MKWQEGFSVPGGIQTGPFQPVKPILFSQFSKFFTFIVGANSYYPQREEGWKWEIGILPIDFWLESPDDDSWLWLSFLKPP